MTDTPPPFTLSAPLDGASPIVLASPHCGTHVPAAAARLLRAPPESIRRIEDAHVAALIAPAARAIAAPLIAATHSRIVIDLNRAETEYDPAMIAGRLAVAAEVSDRVRRGYGLIPRIAGSLRPIHGQPIPAADVGARIATLHRPWHEAIARGLDAARASHGCALLIDCHSMPRLDGIRPAELVIGNRHGQAAAPHLTEELVAIFRDLGLRTTTNHPYAGGYSTSLHGRPGRHIHAVQLEFCRSLYMDSATLAPTAGFATLSATICLAFTRLARALPGLLGSAGIAIAAE